MAKGYTSESDQDLHDTAQEVCEKWILTPGITLVYTDAATFKSQIIDFGKALSERKSAGSQRPGQTNVLDNLDKQYDYTLPDIKTAIANKFGKRNAEANYAQFGIIHRGKKWIFATDRNERYAAIELILNALNNNGLGGITYGTAFWQQMQIDYKKAMDAAGLTDSTVSGKVADLEVYRAPIRKVLKSIRLVLEGNYPETYHQIWREWGFRKQDY